MLGILDSMKKFRFDKKISTPEKIFDWLSEFDMKKLFSTRQKYSRLGKNIPDSAKIFSTRGKNSRPLLSIIACHSTYRVGIYSCKTFKPLAVFFFFFFFFTHLFILSTKVIVITSQRLHAIAFDSRHFFLPGMQNSGIGTVPPLRYQ